MTSPSWQQRQQHADNLIQAALAAVEPAQAVRRNLRMEAGQLWLGEQPLQLGSGGQIFVVGAGKAGLAMGRASQDILGDRLQRGVMAVPQAPAQNGPIRWLQGGHPVPTEGSLAAGRAIAECLHEARAEDLVLALISGGGSALMELPVEGVSLADLQATTQALLRCGASIDEINAVRHQLSQLKGGGLSRMAAPAPVVSLILSDVVGDRLDIIASGPTVAPVTTAQQAAAVVDHYQLGDQLPAAVIDRLQVAAAAGKPETPPSQSILIGSNRQAAVAVVDEAEKLGFHGLLLTNYLEGEAAQAGAFCAALAKSIRRHGDPVEPPACLILGGETTVQVTGPGSGGRNQELALAAAIELDGWHRCALLTLATDGVDGPTPSAGALVTGQTAQAGRAAGLDPLKHLAQNDSHTFLTALAADFRLGPTGTNVNDLAIVMVYE